MTISPGYWTDRTAIVTGATKGIGRATAILLAQRGAHVVVHGRDETQAQELVATLRAAGASASFVLADLRDAAAPQKVIDAALAETARLDLLVNNAGANVFKGTQDATLDDWNDCLNLDLRAVWLASKAAAAVMQPGAAIVNVSSNHATSTLAGVFPYNVAKAGVNALSQSLSIELAAGGIRVNTVAPGYIDTPINEAYFATFPNAEQARADAESLHPLARLGTAEEVAHAIEFFGDSSRSGFTTGTILTLDGGRSALLQDPPSAQAQLGTADKAHTS